MPPQVLGTEAFMKVNSEGARDNQSVSPSGAVGIPRLHLARCQQPMSPNFVLENIVRIGLLKSGWDPL
jgi:hypothetical protein